MSSATVKKIQNISFIAIAAAAVMLALIAAPLAPVEGAAAPQLSQTGNGLQISPAVRDFTLDPGESTAYEIRLTNITGLPIVAQGVVTDFEQKAGEEGIPQLLVDESKESPYSLKGFLPELGTIELKPREQRVLDITITVPKDAAAGAHYGAIRFTTNGSAKPGETVVTLGAGVGVLLFVNVTGEAKDGLAMLQISAAKNGKLGRLFDSGPIDVVTRLRNTGTTYLKPFGRIVVRDWKNRTIEEKDYNAENKKIIIPGTVRRLDDKLDRNRKYFGKYSVEVQMSYGTGGGNIIIAKADFWVLPWHRMLIIAGIALAAVILVILGLASYRRRILRQARRSRW